MADTHPQIEFAERHLLSLHHTFDAVSALARIEYLLSELANLEKLLKTPVAEAQRSKRLGAEIEIVSYYVVGFVTCLEWHARSRIVDLFSYLPRCIEPKDIKGSLGEKVLAQMVAANLTIPQLLGVLRPVGSAKAYIETFERIYRDLGFSVKPYDLIRSIVLDKGDAESVNKLEILFDSRHLLVHEITIDQVGAYYQRGFLPLAVIRQLGECTKNVIITIEKEITKSAPTDFPNLLDEEGRQISDVDRLTKQIEDLEEVISEKFKKDSELGGSIDWQQALIISRQNMSTQDNLVFHAPYLHNRHVDLKQPFLLMNRRGRLEFLKRLSAEINEAIGAPM